MSHHDNRATLDQSLADLYAGRIEEATAALADDAVVDWPQSGERMVGKQACSLVFKNYPGGSPAYQVRRISGGADLFVVEAIARYGDDILYTTSIVEFRNGKITKQTDYFGEPFAPPAWRSEWVQLMEQV